MFADQWIADVTSDLKPSTVRFYSDNLKNHIAPMMGHLRLTEIRRRDVLALIRALRQKDLKLNTVKGAVRTLSALMSAALDEELIDANPVASLRKKLRRGKEAKPEPDPLSVADAQLLTDTARLHFPRWDAFVFCALRTGMRLSELVG